MYYFDYNYENSGGIYVFCANPNGLGCSIAHITPKYAGHKFSGWSLDGKTNCVGGTYGVSALPEYLTETKYLACWDVENNSSEVVETPEDPKTQTINSYRYVMDNAFYQGENVSCSDKVYVTNCDDNYCEVTSINGVNVGTTTLVYKNKINTSDTINSCSSKVRYIKENGYYYSDKDLSKDKKAISCSSEIKLIKSLGDACDNKACEVSINDKSVYLDKELLVTSKPTCTLLVTSTSSNKRLNKNRKKDTNIIKIIIFK